MSLFKERAVNAKKVIALQNEIFSLKKQLKENSNLAQCQNCASLEEMLEESLAAKEVVEAELKSVKGELKKLRSENTKLNKKLSTPEES